MRLTLRTLLAYLDDTLEPAEIKQIGQKVAESDQARELIARIRQITRRRRLTTPPMSGPGAGNFDPNTVAEYLDNELSSEQLAEVEKLCLESDVHLAEIATCHQILTLVLGEPALVPPTARERMYGLVQGKESIPFRKAAVTRTPAVTGTAGNGEEADESPLGQVMRRGGWGRWVVPAAGVLLVVGLGLILTKMLSEGPEARQQVAANNKPAATEAENPAPPAPAANDAGGSGAVKDAAREKEKENEAARAVVTEKPKEEGKAPPEKAPVTEAAKGPATPAAAPANPPPAPAAASEQAGAPAAGRREVGTYTAAARSGPTILVQRQGEQPWRRLMPGTRVFSNDPLVSLPGYLSEVRLDSGVQLQLRGLIPEFASARLMGFLPESAVVLHPAKDVDLDFTLDRGRVYFSNHKETGPARVRLRFGREIWEVALAEPGAEVIVDLMQRIDGDLGWQTGEAPYTDVFVGFIKGKGAFKADYREFPMEMPGPAFLFWNNKRAGLSQPAKLPRPFAEWDKSPPATRDANEMSLALEDLSKRMTEQKAVDVALLEGLQSDQVAQRKVSIYALGALDEVRRLMDVLGDEDRNRDIDRITAVGVLRRWMAGGPEMGKLLYDREKKTGLLTDNRKYLTGEAETILKMLYGFSSAESRSPDTYRVLADYLLSPKIAVRLLAIDQLYTLGAPIKFDPAWPEAERQKAAAEVNKMVDDHKLPPPLRGPAAPGAAPAAPACTPPAPGGRTGR